jgi:hypothetical protein
MPRALGSTDGGKKVDMEERRDRGDNGHLAVELSGRLKIIRDVHL